MPHTPLQKIRNLQTELLNERPFFFSQKRYSYFFVQTNGSYVLDITTLKNENLLHSTSPIATTNAIKDLLNQYNKLPFWKQCWWVLTRPIQIYQKIYAINTLSRLQDAAKQDLSQARQLYNESQIQPSRLDFLFNNWKVELQEIMTGQPEQPATPPVENLHSTSSATQMQPLHNIPKANTESNPYLVALSDELAKGRLCSITKVVDIYENLKFGLSPISSDRLHKLENKIRLIVHPDKNLPENTEEATKQFHRFEELRKKTANRWPLSEDEMTAMELSNMLDELEKRLDAFYEKLARNREIIYLTFTAQLEQGKSELKQMEAELQQERLEQEKIRVERQQFILEMQRKIEYVTNIPEPKQVASSPADTKTTEKL